MKGGSWYSRGLTNAPGKASNHELDILEDRVRKSVSFQPEERPRKKIFISYRYQDSGVVNEFRVKAREDDKSSYQFVDMSLNVPIDSKSANYVKEAISKRINQSSAVLVAVSDTTHESKWVNWEIREAIKMDKKVVAFKLTDTAAIPDALRENNIIMLPNDQAQISQALGDS